MVRHGTADHGPGGDSVDESSDGLMDPVGRKSDDGAGELPGGWWIGCCGTTERTPQRAPQTGQFGFFDDPTGAVGV